MAPRVAQVPLVHVPLQGLAPLHAVAVKHLDLAGTRDRQEGVSCSISGSAVTSYLMRFRDIEAPTTTRKDFSGAAAAGGGMHPAFMSLFMPPKSCMCWVKSRLAAG